MLEEKNMITMPHNINLEDRRSLAVSGVSDVDSFDEETIVVFTQQGELTIRGLNLHINRLSVDVGELSVEGKINSLEYTDNQPKASGFFGKVFR